MIVVNSELKFALLMSNPDVLFFLSLTPRASEKQMHISAVAARVFLVPTVVPFVSFPLMAVFKSPPPLTSFNSELSGVKRD